MDIAVQVPNFLGRIEFKIEFYGYFLESLRMFLRM